MILAMAPMWMHVNWVSRRNPVTLTLRKPFEDPSKTFLETTKTFFDFDIPLRGPSSPQYPQDFDGDDTHEWLEKAKVLSASGEAPDGTPISKKYRLRAVVCHKGDQTEMGHYVCDVYNSKDRVWRTYDDSIVRKTAEEIIFGNDRQKNGYVLFYEHVPQMPVESNKRNTHRIH
eukprot:Rmarinus@m.29522